MKRILPFLLLVCATICPAQDPPELTDLRGKYLEALKGIREPIQAKYIAQMEEMLAQATREGRLEEALAVRSAIRSMKEVETPNVASVDPPDEPGRPERPFGRPDRFDGDDKDDISVRPGTTVLSADDATLEGALKNYRGYITNWIRPNCRARWHDRDVAGGKYDVFFVYSAGSGQGGTIHVTDFGYDFDVKISQTGWRDLERIKVGTIETRGGIGMQVISKTTSDEGVMNLKEIHLVPAK